MSAEKTFQALSVKWKNHKICNSKEYLSGITFIGFGQRSVVITMVIYSFLKFLLHQGGGNFNKRKMFIFHGDDFSMNLIIDCGMSRCLTDERNFLMASQLKRFMRISTGLNIFRVGVENFFDLDVASSRWNVWDKTFVDTIKWQRQFVSEEETFPTFQLSEEIFSKKLNLYFSWRLKGVLGLHVNDRITEDFHFKTDWDWFNFVSFKV